MHYVLQSNAAKSWKLGLSVGLNLALIQVMARALHVTFEAILSDVPYGGL